MEEALVKRVMPNSLEAEQSVIGSMIMDREAIITAMEMLIIDDFYFKQYGLLFQAMVDLFDAGEPIDLVTLQAKLKAMNVPEEVSSLEFVRDLLTSVPTSANVSSYAQIVKDKSVLRRLIKITEEISNKCYVGQGDLDEILADTEKNIFNLIQNQGGKDYVPIKEIVLNALEKIEQASKTQGNVTGIHTGFVDLDYKMSGLQPSDFILVAARPSMGKTAFVLNIAQYDAQVLRSGNLSDSDWEKLIEGAGVIGSSNLIIDDTPGISISELRSKCRKFKLEHDLKLIIIDYLQLMSGGKNRSDSRQQEISEISRSLKGLARELNMPILHYPS